MLTTHLYLTPWDWVLGKQKHVLQVLHSSSLSEVWGQAVQNVRLAVQNRMVLKPLRWLYYRYIFDKLDILTHGFFVPVRVSFFRQRFWTGPVCLPSNIVSYCIGKKKTKTWAHLLCERFVFLFNRNRMLKGESIALKMYENRFWGEIDLWKSIQNHQGWELRFLNVNRFLFFFPN